VLKLAVDKLLRIRYGILGTLDVKGDFMQEAFIMRGSKGARVAVTLIPLPILHLLALHLWYKEEAKTYLGDTWLSFYREATVGDWIEYHFGAIVWACLGCIVVTFIFTYVVTAMNFVRTGSLHPPSNKTPEDQD